MHPVPPLCFETLNHWRLLAAPFSVSRPVHEPAETEEFYFRGGDHAELWSWFAHAIEHAKPLNVIVAPSGTGITMFFRQILASTGVGSHAIDVATGEWNQPERNPRVWPTATRPAFHDSTRYQPVRLIDVPSHINPLPASTSICSLTDSYPDECVFVRIRPTRSNMTGQLSATERTLRVFGTADRTLHLPSPKSEHLQACLAKSIRHVGAMEDVFTHDAAAWLAQQSTGYQDLATRVHQALMLGHAKGLRRIDRRDAQTLLEPEVNYRAA